MLSEHKSMVSQLGKKLVTANLNTRRQTSQALQLQQMKSWTDSKLEMITDTLLTFALSYMREYLLFMYGFFSH